MGAEHTALLFFSDARWLSRGKVLKRMFKLRHEVFCFLNGENHSLADSFSNKDFLLKMAYLTDIFEKLNILNTSLQGNEATVLSWNDKVKAFMRKLELWRNSMESDTLDMFPTLVSMVQDTDNPVLPMDIKSCLLDHLIMLKVHFEKYFCNDFDKFNWIKNPFENAPGPSSLKVNEQEQLIDLTSDTSLKSKFKELSLLEFWIHIGKEFPTLSQKALKILIPFATTYLCETGFSALAAIKSKYRSRLNIAKEVRVAISDITPRFDKLCSQKQAHPSH